MSDRQKRAYVNAAGWPWVAGWLLAADSAARIAASFGLPPGPAAAGTPAWDDWPELVVDDRVERISPPRPPASPAPLAAGRLRRVGHV